MLWYEEKCDGTALSTRVRFARNLEGVPFPSCLDSKQLKEVNQDICAKIMSCDVFEQPLRVINMETLGDIEAFSMIERHIISPKFAAERDGRLLLLSEDESISIMIGEEDHLRIQVIKPGEQLEKAFEICNKIDNAIGAKLKFAFDEKLGFLTECPTNLGTGMRASVMLHLPLLESNGQLKTISNATSKIGLTFRGFYGEGSDSKASIYQLSNQITLGVSEKAAIENLQNITRQIITRENEAIISIDRNSLSDVVCRSLGVLKYARIITTKEMMKHASSIMLGIKNGILNDDDIRVMKLFIDSQPAMIKRIYGEVEPEKRDVLRAEILRKMLKNCEPTDS